MRQRKVQGTIVLPSGVNVWPHELRIAKVLSDSGRTVQFLIPSKKHLAKSPDILLDGIVYEIKSPKSNKLSAIERNLKRAYHQSPNIIFDSHRMKGIPDTRILAELNKQFGHTKKMKRLLFISRKGEIIDLA